MEIIVKDLCKTFYSQNGSIEALDGVNLTVRSGEFLAIIGPSGCGKSTMLEIIAGLTPPSAGHVLIDATQNTSPTSNMAIVFQQYALFPWRTILGNLQYVLEVQNIHRTEWHGRCEHYLNLFQLWEFREAYPSQLSGGMKQRVALARALIGEPHALLMDEPFSSLDAISRYHAQVIFAEILEHHPKTVIFVTHDVDEALLLADRIVVFSSRPGRVRQSIDIEYDPLMRNMWSPQMLNLRSQIWQLLEGGKSTRILKPYQRESAFMGPVVEDGNMGSHNE